ncbi:type II secretion system protein N [Sphingomonas lenta]|uniref:Type II secretory protein PulC n=1 Tax=Sphingomonas lenta TaxID=1141887 RepID=A0A2A2SKB3_9SPHN|nr:type II secretion system protein N [Sphingomonas lenta]PAX09686.1 type II secretory protein PulC [Sphingomonas lenta]
MRLQLDARARRWLRRLPVVNLYSAAELALMAVLAGQAARLVWAIATPVSPLGEWRPAPVVTPASPVDTLTSFDPFFRLTGPAQAAGPVAVTSLQLTLFGTRIDDATGGGSAILAGPDGVQKSVSVGEEVAPGVRLAAVAFDHVTLDRGGPREDLYLDQSQAPGATTPGVVPPAITGATVVAPAGSGVTVPQLRQDIGFIPRIDGGRLSGLVLRSQGTGDAFRQIGLQDGDVLTSIGGRAVTGADALDGLQRQYPQGGNVPLTVERGGQPVQLSITIAPPQ